jgi:two-component system, OmpR family, phosphate regulon sensor histidine kinase PhoR
MEFPKNFPCEYNIEMWTRYFLSLLSILAITLVMVGLLTFRIPENRVLLPGFLLIVVVLVFVSALLAYLLSARFDRSVMELTDAIRRLGNHDFSAASNTAETREFATLGQSVNLARDQLAAYYVELMRDHEQLNAILSGMVEGVVALDNTERILFANARACDLLDLNPQAIKGRKIGDLIREPAIQTIVEKAMFQSGTCREELDWHGSETRNLAVYVSRLSSPESTGAVMVLHDITDLRRLERLRQDFVANVSHELKTPLAVIQSNVEALIDGAAEDPVARLSFLGRVQHEANRLDELIQDAIADCLERHATRAEEKSMSIIEVPPKNSSKDLRVWADPDQLGHILDNLFVNAMKYTPNGGKVTIRWEAEPDFVRIEVEDNGVGISKEDLPRIFERFFRADKARNRSAGGTGLGLAIVKHLVQTLDGQISVTSTLDVGTTFRVALPRAES